MLRLPRSTKLAILATVTCAAAAVSSGDGVARASYMADPNHPQHTARKVRVAIDRDDPVATQLMRLDLDEPPHIDALPAAVTTSVPQRPVRLDLADTTDSPPPMVLPPTPRRVVRLSLDGAAPNDLAPRVFHADLDDVETFTTSAPGGIGPVRLVRSDL